jgi:phosphohistidine phosphatase
MKTLLLLRHAKSSWKDAGLQDFDRPLNERGKKAAEMIGRFIRNKQVAPDLLVCSPALRARETIEIVIKTGKLRSELRYDERIYEASPLRLLEVVSQIEEERKIVVLVGHNPGMEELLRLMTDRVEHMTTGTLARINFTVARWEKVPDEKGILEWIVRPKEVADR